MSCTLPPASPLSSLKISRRRSSFDTVVGLGDPTRNFSAFSLLDGVSRSRAYPADHDLVLCNAAGVPLLSKRLSAPDLVAKVLTGSSDNRRCSKSTTLSGCQAAKPSGPAGEVFRWGSGGAFAGNRAGTGKGGSFADDVARCTSVEAFRNSWE